MPKGYKKSWGKCVDNSVPLVLAIFPCNYHKIQHYNCAPRLHFPPLKVGLGGHPEATAEGSDTSMCRNAWG